MSKRWLILLPVLLLIIGAGLLFYLSHNSALIGDFVLKQTSSVIGREIVAESIQASWMPLGIRLRNIRVSEAPEFSGEGFFLSAEEVTVSIDAFQLLWGQFRVEAFQLEAPVIFLRQNGNGRWNIASLTQERGREAAADSGGRIPNAFPLRGGSVHNGTLLVEPSNQAPVRVENLFLEVSDIESRQAVPISFVVRQEEGTISAKGVLGPLENRAPLESPFDLDLEISDFAIANLGDRVPLGSLHPFIKRVSGPMQVAKKGSVMTLTGSLNHSDRIFFSDNENSYLDPFSLDISLSLDGAKGSNLSGSVAIAELTLSAKGQPFQAESLKLQLDPKGLVGEAFQLRAGSDLTLSASGEVRLGDEAPELSARITFSDQKAESLMELLETFQGDLGGLGLDGGRLTGGLDISGPFLESDLPTYSANVLLEEALLQHQNWHVSPFIETARVLLRPDSLQIDEARFKIDGSELRGALQLQGFGSPKLSFTLRGDQLDATGFVQSQAASKRRAPSRDLEQETWIATITGMGQIDLQNLRYGTLDAGPISCQVELSKGLLIWRPLQFGFYSGLGQGELEIDLRGEEVQTTFGGSLKDMDVNQYLKANSSSGDVLFGRLTTSLRLEMMGTERDRRVATARGSGEARLTDGRLSKLNLNKTLSAVSRLAGLRLDGEDTQIDEMLATYQVADGWVRSNDFRLTTPDLRMTAQGGFSFDRELDMEATAVFNEEASRRIKSRVGVAGLAGGIFRDRRGRVVLPVNIRGTIEKPQATIDVKRLIKLKLGL